MSTPKHKALIVDTNAIINGIHVERLADKLYTIPEVEKEVRDKNTREGLINKIIMPSAIIRNPEPSDVKKVIAVAKEVGDYPFLSAPDIKLIALTLTIKNEIEEEEAKEAAKEEEEVEKTEVEEENVEEEEEEGDDNEEEEEEGEEEEEEEEEEDNDENDDDDGEWITPDNLSEMKAKIENTPSEDEESVSAGCITADFSMQNVLMHMKLSVVSYNGMRIRRATTHIQKCWSCYSLVKDNSKVYCPFCGNSTLRRVIVETNDNGEFKEVEGQNFRISTKGMKYSLPKPKGGRNNHDPITSEDQLKHYLRTMPKPRSDDISGMGYVADDSFGKRMGRGLTVQQQKKLVGASGLNPNIPRKRLGKKNKAKKISY